MRSYLSMEPFGLAHYRQAMHAATELALQKDSIALGVSILDALRHRHIILPTRYRLQIVNLASGHQVF